MFDVSLSTLVSVVLVLLFIIFVLMISKVKPNQNQVKEMKETGWEIVGEIQHYLEKIEASKQEIDEKLAEIKAIEQTIHQTKPSAPASETCRRGSTEPHGRRLEESGDIGLELCFRHLAGLADL